MRANLLVGTIGALVLAGFEIANGTRYLQQANGTLASPGFVTMRGASANGMISRIARDRASFGVDTTVLSDTLNIGVEELDGLALRGRRVLFLAQDLFLAYEPGHQPIAPPPWLAARIAAPGGRLASASSYEHVTMPSGGASNSVYDSPAVAAALADPATILLHDTSASFVVDRDGSDPPTRFPERLRIGDIDSLLIFLPSTLGPTIWSVGAPENVTLDLPERDPFKTGAWIQGFSRYALFEVVGSRPGRHVLVDETTTSFHDDATLGTARVDGDVGARMPFVGSGSGRLYSAPVSPHRAQGLDLLQLDLGRDARLHQSTGLGLLGAFNGDIPLDRRYLTAFAREISLVSDDTYRHLARPTGIAAFPADLYDRGLEYSGIYEDGWLSTEALVRLREAPDGTPVRIRGSIPRTGDNENVHYRLAISAGGVHRVYDERVGPFEISLPSASAGAPTDVRIAVDPPVRLPEPDGRDVGFRIASIGYADEPDDLATTTDAATGVRLGIGWYPHESFGGRTFRWLRSGATLSVARRTAGPLTLRFHAAPGPSLAAPGATRVVLDGPDGAELASADVDGESTFALTVPAHAGMDTFVLHVDGATDRHASSADQRTLDLQVFSLDAS